MANEHKASPFAPADLAELPPIKGVRLAVAEAGIKYANRTDVVLMLFPEGTEVGGVLTRSKTCSAPVDWCREQLQHGSGRALLVNSGNANAFTGWRGRETVEATAAFAAEAIECEPERVFIASTGVIGEPLDASKFKHVLKEMAPRAREGLWVDAARAIMTTDTFPKLATRRALIGDAPVTLNGIAKGSGMIAPDMATMLSFIVTDAPVESHALTRLLQQHAKSTFNAITVDSDTSTSDTLLIFATGEAAQHGAPKIASPDDPEAAAFSAALLRLMHDLSMQVIKDGEGITKLITIHVEGAENDAAAHRIGLSIGNSPLVKTAVAGEDANWGRIVAAVGKSGEAANRDRLSIWFGHIQVAKDGMRHPDYQEAQGAAYMKRGEIEIRVDAGTGGHGRATVWASDLTHGYIDINADYRS